MKKMLFLTCLLFGLSVYGNRPVRFENRYKKHIHLMNNETFGFFISELKNTWPNDKKYKIYLRYLTKYNLTVDQLIKITSLITFDSDKIETISLLYPIVIDKENRIELLNTVNDKEALIKLLK